MYVERLAKRYNAVDGDFLRRHQIINKNRVREMKYLFNRTVLIILLLFIMVPYLSAEENIVKVGISSKKAKVTFLEGSVTLIRKGIEKVMTVSTGDYLIQGDRINTEKDSKIEIRLPDKSFIRFGEETSFELEAVAYNQKTRKRNININMILGKTWAKVAKLFGGGRFDISTKTAVAGVRGTVYRVNVNENNSAVVKVYWGEVAVKGKPSTNNSGPEESYSNPVQVLGPHPVAGPRQVSAEEWVYMVKSLQQINISPDGKAEKPFNFDIESDLNDWVRWNKLRDEQLKNEND